LNLYEWYSTLSLSILLFYATLFRRKAYKYLKSYKYYEKDSKEKWEFFEMIQNGGKRAIILS
jgi:hypothetical protein